MEFWISSRCLLQELVIDILCSGVEQNCVPSIRVSEIGKDRNKTDIVKEKRVDKVGNALQYHL
jgi:hypothetical protein